MKYPRVLPLHIMGEFNTRFIFWGIQSIVVLFIAAKLKIDIDSSYDLYASFTSFSFMLSLLGGAISNRLLSSVSCLKWSPIYQIFGCLLLCSTLKVFMYLGLSALAFGNGIFLTNNSSCLAQRYTAYTSQSKERGFTLLYLGTNLGGIIGPLIFGFNAKYLNFRYSFIIGVVFIIIWYLYYFYLQKRERYLFSKESLLKCLAFIWLSILVILFGYFGLVYINLIKIAMYTVTCCALVFWIKCISSKKLNNQQKESILISLLLIFFILCFFGCEFQINTSFLEFLKNFSNFNMGGIKVPVSVYAGIEPLFVAVLSPISVFFFNKIEKDKAPLSSLTKIALGFLISAFAFWLFSRIAFNVKHESVAFDFIFASFILAIAEIMIMPIGIAYISHKVDKKSQPLMIGMLYLSLSFSGLLASFISKSTTAFNNSHIISLYVYVYYECAKYLLYLAAGCAIISFYSRIRKI